MSSDIHILDLLFPLPHILLIFFIKHSFFCISQVALNHQNALI